MLLTPHRSSAESEIVSCQKAILPACQRLTPLQAMAGRPSAFDLAGLAGVILR